MKPPLFEFVVVDAGGSAMHTGYIHMLRNRLIIDYGTNVLDGCAWYFSPPQNHALEDEIFTLTSLSPASSGEYPILPPATKELCLASLPWRISSTIPRDEVRLVDEETGALVGLIKHLRLPDEY